MNIVLSDKGLYKNFLPLSYTRSVSDYRVGILTIREKWEHYIGYKPGVITEDYLQYMYLYNLEKDTIIVVSNLIPDQKLIDFLKNTSESTVIKDGQVIAYNYNKSDDNDLPKNQIEYKNDLIILNSNTDVFSLNGICIQNDFELITKKRKSNSLSKTNTIFGDYPVFTEDGCFVECTTINTSDGPVYIGKNAKIMEGSHIRGPFALCESAEIKMGAKIYGPTTIGPWCKVGGEINNSIFFAYSNKAHDGFLGNSVIGEWCNLGADSNNSNLKNNYTIVKLWDYETLRFKNTNLQFCGLIMADHSKCGINTMFNTGTAVGVSANIFGSGFPRNFIPSFSWGGHAGITEFKLNTAFEIMSKVMQRRGKELSKDNKKMFDHIFNESSVFRKF
jgi:UDP-N-acetylglucosamine diphosphorylase/glucosamine-1-phosphate N-acetyltransferase